MVVSEIEKHYREDLEQKNSRLKFGNSILYCICKENPFHDNEDIVIGKCGL